MSDRNGRDGNGRDGNGRDGEENIRVRGLDLNNVDSDTVILRGETVTGTSSGEKIFVREDGAVIDGGGGIDTILSWSDNIEIKDREKDDFVVVSGNKISVTGGTVESYGDGAVIDAGRVTITGSDIKSAAQSTDAWFSRGARVSGTDDEDTVIGTIVKRSEIETGQDNDNISLSFSRNNKIYLGYQSLWESERRLKDHLIAVDKKIEALVGKIENLKSEISIYRGFVDDKYRKIVRELQEEKEGAAIDLERLEEDRKNSIKAFNDKYRLDLSSDTTIEKIEASTSVISDGNNECEDFKGIQNYVYCGNGTDTVILQDCDHDTIKGNGGACLIREKNSTKPSGNVFVLGRGYDTIWGYNDKDTIIVDNHSFASISSSVDQTLRGNGDLSLTLWQPKLLKIKGREETGANLIINQDLQFDGGIPAEVTIQGHVYTVEDKEEPDRFDLLLKEEDRVVDRGDSWETVKGSIIIEAEGRGSYKEERRGARLVSSDCTINAQDLIMPGDLDLAVTDQQDQRKIVVNSDQPTEILTQNVTIEPHTVIDTEQISVRGGMIEVPKIESIEGSVTTETVEVYSFVESSTSAIMAVITTPDQESAEQYEDEYANRLRYDLLLKREITGKGTLNERTVQKIDTIILPTFNEEEEKTGAITIVGVDKVPKNVKGRFNYNYYNRVR